SGHARCSTWAALYAIDPDTVGADWSGDILDLQHSNVIKWQIKLPLKVIISSAGNQHTARRTSLFEPSSNVHTIAEEIVVFGDHIAKIDANAEYDAAMRIHIQLSR